MRDARQSKRKMLVVVWLISLAVVVLAAGCGDDSNDSEGAAESVVEVSHASFKPGQVHVDAGDTVIFRNIVEMSHPLVSEEAGLDTGEFLKGDLSFTFDAPGTFTITNTAHANTMNVTVR